MTESNSSRILKNYVNGRWCEPSVDEFLDVCNPSNGQILAKVPMSGEAEVNHAVSTARTAFDLWRRTPVAQRCAPVRRLAELLRENFEVLSRQITEEMGKSLPNARASTFPASYPDGYTFNFILRRKGKS